MFLACTVLGMFFFFFLLKCVKICSTLIVMINVFLILLCDISCLLISFCMYVEPSLHS